MRVYHFVDGWRNALLRCCSRNGEKEFILKVRVLFLSATAGVALLGFSSLAAAAPVSGPNPNSQAANSGNCVAEASSGVTHNGLHGGETLGVGNNVSGNDNTSHGQRGDEIKALQASCAHD
jgi:hypothetical protein